MKTQQAPKTYEPGWFLQPALAWRSMRFESRPIMAVDSKTRRFKTDFARAAALRSGGGFDNAPIFMPGSRL